MAKPTPTTTPDPCCTAAARAAFSIPLGPRVVRVLNTILDAGNTISVLLEGSTGIGKSEIAKQIALVRDMQHRILDLKVMDPTDLLGIPYIVDGRTHFAPPAKLPTTGEGILVLEELNRAQPELQQASFQLLTERCIHDYRLPEGWTVWALINPADGEYQVTEMDRALRDRFLPLVVHADRESWLVWARKAGVHRAVLHIATEHDHVFETVTPRTWKKVSDLLWSLGQEQLHDQTLICDLFGHLLGEAWLTTLVTAVERTDGPDGIDAAALLASYDREPDLQNLVVSFKLTGKTDKLEQIVTRIESALAGAELPGLVAEGHFRLEAFEALISDLPGDFRERLQKAIGDKPAAIPLVTVTPAEFLSSTGSTRARERITRWLAKPTRSHRVDLFLTALADYVTRKSDLSPLRKDTHARKMLGWLIKEVGETRCRRLVAALREREVRPMSADVSKAA